MSIVESSLFTWATRSFRPALAVAVSWATVTPVVAPIVAEPESVRLTPGVRFVKVLVADLAAMPTPRLISASEPALTAAPPRSVLPSVLVSVKSVVAPVAVDWASRR